VAEYYSGTYSGPMGYAGTPYSERRFIYDFGPIETTTTFITPYFSGPGGSYTGPGFIALNMTPVGTFPVFYSGPAGPPYSGNFEGSRNYALDPPDGYVGFYAAPNINYSGNYSGSRNYAGNYLGTGDFAGPQNYSGSRNYAGNYLGNVNYSGPQNYSGPRNYSGNYLGTGNFVGPQNYSGNYLGTGNFAGPQNYSGSRTYSGNYAGGGSFSGTYSGSRNYAGIYNGPANYSGNYSNAFSGNYTGTFSGATIQASKETVSSVKLWIRTA
jgi:hypothetical protein